MQDSNDSLNLGLLGLFVGIVGLVLLIVFAVVAFVLMLGGLTPPSVVAEMTASAVAAVEETRTAEALAEAEAAPLPSPTMEPIVVVVDGAAPLVTPTPDPNALNRLAIITDRGDLITVNRDGGDLRQLNAEDDRTIYSFPAWSPDSESIAVIGLAGRGRLDGVFVFDDSAETAPTRVHSSSQPPIYLSWSPTSEEIGFIANQDGDPSLLDFRIVPRDGSEQSREVASGAPFYWDWTSTGDELIFKTDRSSHAEFAFAQTTRDEIGDEIAEASPFFQSPDISADDDYFAYGLTEDNKRQIIIEERATGRRTATEHLGVAAFAWNPVTNQLALVSPTRQILRPVGPLRLLELNGDSRTIVDDNVIAFFWSPDGTKIAYLTLSGGNGVGRDALIRNGMLGAASQQQQQIVLKFDISVVDVASRERLLLGSVQPGELFVRQLLPFYDQYAHSHSLWSSDSRSFAIPIIDEMGDTVVYRFDVDGSRPMPIAPGVVGFWSQR